MDTVSFRTAGCTELSFEDNSFDVVVMHTLLTHVADQQQMLGEAHRVLRADGWLAVFDADFATESVAVTGNDPLEVCIDAHREFFVHDPCFVRRMSAVLTQAGFDPGPVVSYGQVDSANEVGSTGWVDMGANALAADGRITEAMASAYSQEAQHRLEAGTWFSYLAFASLIARPARIDPEDQPALPGGG
jgi:arsenite methyltransferase